MNTNGDLVSGEFFPAYFLLSHFSALNHESFPKYLDVSVL